MTGSDNYSTKRLEMLFTIWVAYFQAVLVYITEMQEASLAKLLK